MAPPTHPSGVNFLEDSPQSDYIDSSTYYGLDRFPRNRTYSNVKTFFFCTRGSFLNFLFQAHLYGYNPKRRQFEQDDIPRTRRLSHDEKSSTAPRRFLIDVDETIRLVLEQEDTDGDFQVSITDSGPKVMSLGTATSNGFKTFDIRASRIYC